MAVLSSAISIARELSGTDVNSFSDTLCIDFANAVSFKMRKMLIDRGIDASPVQEATRNITDGTGTYLYPTDMFYVPKYVEVNWFESPVTGKNFKQTDKVKESDVPAGESIGWLRVNQPGNSPLVDYRGDYFEIFPTPAATMWGGAAGSTLSAALRIFYYLQPVLYTTTGDTLTNPEGLDYFSFADLMKDTYNYSIGKMSKDELEKAFVQEVGKLIHIIQGDGMQQTTFKGLGITGWEF